MILPNDWAEVWKVKLMRRASCAGWPYLFIICCEVRGPRPRRDNSRSTLEEDFEEDANIFDFRLKMFF